jgi:hypothetical protein
MFIQVMRYMLAVLVAGVLSVLIGAVPQVLTLMYHDMMVLALALLVLLLIITTLVAGRLYDSWFVSGGLIVFLLYAESVEKALVSAGTLTRALESADMEHMRIVEGYLSNPAWFGSWQMYALIFAFLVVSFCTQSYRAQCRC